MRKIFHLFTPQHSGTHAARILYELHTNVSFCYWDSQWRRDDWFIQKMIWSDPWNLIEAWQERLPRILENLPFERGLEYESIGYKLGDKRADCLFIHSHIKPEHIGTLPPAGMANIVTLRHPFNVMITEFRKGKVLQDIKDGLQILHHACRLALCNAAYIIRTDLDTAQDKLDLVARSGLSLWPEQIRFARNNPQINTTGPEDFFTEIGKRYFASGKVSHLVEEVWESLSQEQKQDFRRAGYTI
jgi:hypothetical protein